METVNGLLLLLLLLLLQRIHSGTAAAAASKMARHSATSAARCAMSRRLSSGVTLVSHRGCRTNGLPIDEGGFGHVAVPARAVLR